MTKRYLTFTLNGNRYGIDIMKVVEIFGYRQPVVHEHAPKHIKGVIKNRGHVITVCDLRIKLGMAEIDITDETCIICVDVEGMRMGLIVDCVDAVEGIDPNDTVVKLLDVDEILSNDNIVKGD